MSRHEFILRCYVVQGIPLITGGFFLHVLKYVKISLREEIFICEISRINFSNTLQRNVIFQ